MKLIAYLFIGENTLIMLQGCDSKPGGFSSINHIHFNLILNIRVDISVQIYSTPLNKRKIADIKLTAGGRQAYPAPAKSQPSSVHVSLISLECTSSIVVIWPIRSSKTGLQSQPQASQTQAGYSVGASFRIPRDSSASGSQ